MLVAELCGKIGDDNPPYARSEDILTSQVLSLFRYFSNFYLPSKLLYRARNLEGEPWQYCKAQDVLEIETHFWPNFSLEGDARSREPDAVLILHTRNGKHLKIVVESKYLSGPSPLNDTTVSSDEIINIDGGFARLSGNQLADEYCSLKCGKWPKLKVMEELTEGQLLYLTAHYEMPKKDLEETLKILKTKDLNQKCNHCLNQASSEIYWLSWRDIYQELLEVETAGCTDYFPPGEKRLMQDVRRLLEKKGLKPFKLGFDFCEVPKYVSFFK